jgi:uroporphyrinogen-III synthase
LREWLPPEATVSEVPLTTTTYFDIDDVRSALGAPTAHGPYRSLVVTSERSARYVDIALHASTPDVELFVVGPSTSRALVAQGIHVDVQGEGSAETLAPHVSRGPVLLLGAVSTRTELPSALRANGFDVDEVACYETVALRLNPSDEATLGQADVLFIGAPSAWSVARDFVMKDAWVVVPGASTAASVRSDHAQVIEGWAPELRTTLAALFAKPAE